MPVMGGEKRLTIGWAIAKEPLSAPAYRRRIGHYLEKRSMDWEPARFGKGYDLVFVHHSADLPLWKDYDKGKIVFDYNDDYLSGPRNSLKDRGRGIARYLAGHWSRPELDYRRAYLKMMRRADAVVCCTDAQQETARRLCRHVFQIADMQPDEDWTVKRVYESGSTFNLVWEGLPDFQGLVCRVPVLREFQRKRKAALHLITSLHHGRFLRNLAPVDTKREVGDKIRLGNTFLYEWNPYLFASIVAACDLAIIPIDLERPFWLYKPSNKLLFFWRIGMPVLTDPTPAYVKLMHECGLDMVCHSSEEWVDMLDKYANDSGARKAAGVRAREFAEREYGEDRLLGKWDEVLNAVL